MTGLGPHGQPIPYFYADHCVNRDASACWKACAKPHIILVWQTQFIEGQWKERDIDGVRNKG